MMQQKKKYEVYFPLVVTVAVLAHHYGGILTIARDDHHQDFEIFSDDWAKVRGAASPTASQPTRLLEIK